MSKVMRYVKYPNVGQYNKGFIDYPKSTLAAGSFVIPPQLAAGPVVGKIDPKVLKKAPIVGQIVEDKPVIMRPKIDPKTQAKIDTLKKEMIKKNPSLAKFYKTLK